MINNNNNNGVNKMTRKEMIKLINKKLDVYFYDWEVKKVLDLCHKIYNDGQTETIEMLKHHNEVKELNQIAKRLVRDELPKMKQILKESKQNYIK